MNERRAVIDVGCIDLIKNGNVSVLNGVVSSLWEEGAIISADGVDSKNVYDAIFFATGFNHSLSKLVDGYLHFEKKKSKEETITSHHPSTRRFTYDSSENLPDTDHIGMSTLRDSLFFIGFDPKKHTTTLGHQGFDAGISISKALGLYSPTNIPAGYIDEDEARRKRLIASMKTFSASIACATVLFIGYSAMRKRPPRSRKR